MIERFHELSSWGINRRIVRITTILLIVTALALVTVISGVVYDMIVQLPQIFRLPDNWLQLNYTSKPKKMVRLDLDWLLGIRTRPRKPGFLDNPGLYLHAIVAEVRSVQLIGGLLQYFWSDRLFLGGRSKRQKKQGHC